MILTVPGARLYYTVRGSGPLLLLLQGGGGDSDASEGIAERLLDRFTVVTYDRRGLSRSLLDQGAEAPSSLETHTDDVHRLLAALTTEPAILVGHSIGAFIGLDLVARHPEQVRVIVAHEPPATQFLPDDERASAVRAQEEVEQIFHREGVAAAAKLMGMVVRASARNREPDFKMPAPTAQASANLAFFLTHDEPATRRHRLDIAALAAAFIGGRDSRGIWTRRSAEELAKRLGAELVEFPGDHNGFTFHPRAFAAGVREILDHSARPEGRCTPWPPDPPPAPSTST
jgi:pimeloyl-ACP methyl ester carboxylesterase